ncbi:ANTAR domain-containing protein [Peptococcaceae bacterium 1198_IL3148]
MYDIRVAIIDPDNNSSKKIKEQLIATGHMVVAEAVDGRAGLRYISQTQPDVILLSIALGTETVKIIEEQRIAPVIIIATDIKWLESLKTICLFGLITPGMGDLLLEATVQIAIQNFNRLRQLEQEVKSLKVTLEERKVIEQAKGLLMEKRGLSESKAFQYMRKLAMDKCVPMVKVARAIIKMLHD